MTPIAFPPLDRLIVSLSPLRFEPVRIVPRRSRAILSLRLDSWSLLS
jgi:hypothetical protein